MVGRFSHLIHSISCRKYAFVALRTRIWTSNLKLCYNILSIYYSGISLDHSIKIFQYIDCYWHVAPFYNVLQSFEFKSFICMLYKTPYWRFFFRCLFGLIFVKLYYFMFLYPFFFVFFMSSTILKFEANHFLWAHFFNNNVNIFRQVCNTYTASRNSKF